MQLHPIIKWLIWTPPKKLIRVDDEDKKPAHVPSATKPKSVGSATKSVPIASATKPAPVASATKLQDDELAKFKIDVDSTFSTIQADLGAVNSNVQGMMQLFMDRLPPKVPIKKLVSPKEEKKMVKLVEVKSDDSIFDPRSDNSYSSDGGINEEEKYEEENNVDQN
jgi:hypothetical protein